VGANSVAASSLRMRGNLARPLVFWHWLWGKIKGTNQSPSTSLPPLIIARTRPVINTRDARTDTRMNELPCEIVSLVLAHSNDLALPVLRCVCPLWNALLKFSARQRGPWKPLNTKRLCDVSPFVKDKHVCATARRCAVHYAHAVVARGWWNILDWMLDCAGPLGSINNVDKSACLRAVLDSDLPRVREWVAKGWEWDRSDAWIHAAHHAQMPVLQWINAQRPLYKLRIMDDVLVRAAAGGGHIHMIEWLRSKGCTWSERACTMAAQEGHLHALQWLRERGCPWDEKVCARAMRNGHLHIVEWARANGCPWDYRTFANAAKVGDVGAARRLLEMNCPWNGDPCALAARHGHFTMLRWLRDNGCPWDGRVCAWAVDGRHRDIILWARQEGCAWSSTACLFAASNGDLDMLRWLRDNGCPWNERTCTDATYDGHFGVLKWARANGCPWSRDASVGAAWGGNLDMLQWLCINECPWDALGICMVATDGGHMHVLEWMHERGDLVRDKRLCTAAACAGRLDVLQWLRTNECPWDHTVCSRAATEGHIEVLEWARDNGCPWNPLAYSKLFPHIDHRELAAYLEADSVRTQQDSDQAKAMHSDDSLIYEASTRAYRY